MNSKEKKDQIKQNAVFMVGGRLYLIKKIEDGNVVVQDVKTGKSMIHGVDALSRFNITFCR